MNYRKEIDGLRAFAVIAVIFFHAEFYLFRGGYVGVDIFFVISGYLISNLIFKEMHSKTFSLKNFYLRRIRRILPALFATLIATVLLAWLFMPPSELKNYGKSLISVTLFSSNFFFWRNTDYFQIDQGLVPLLHTWSLSVEEQYYLVFPIAVALIWRFRRRTKILLLISSFTVSFSLAQILSSMKPMAAYYLLPTRIWELLIGVIATLVLQHRTMSKTPRWIDELLSYLGFSFILFSIIVFSETTPYPSIYTLIPTIGTFLVIVFASTKSTSGQFLGLPFFAGIGLISYSAYLLHQPIFVFSRFLKHDEDTAFKVLLIAIIFSLSILSWYFVEKPFRSPNRIGNRPTLIMATVFTSLLFLMGQITSRVDLGFEKEMAQSLAGHPAIFTTNMDERIFIKYRIESMSYSPQTLIVGSSRAMQVGNNINSGTNLNLSVSGASIEDLLTISYLATEKYTPQKIYLSADPWVFNKNNNQNRWNSLSSEYQLALNHFGIFKVQLHKFNSDSIPFNGFFAQLYRIFNRTKIFATDDQPSLMDKIREDGSRVYNTGYSNRSVQAVELEALEVLGYGMNNFEYSEDARFYFERLVRNLKTKSEVVLILSPYHPKTFNAMEKNRPEFLQLEKTFRDIAAQTGVEIIGSYNPNIAQCDKGEFFDGMHPKASCMLKILKP